MPMWRVQTEGYRDGNGMITGTVSYDLTDAPDGEFISGGLNSKGPNSMAIGRQGSYLHWGFAASPTYMTDEAKLVFVNSIHYIRKFSGQRAFSRLESVTLRSSIDRVLYQLSDEGNAAMADFTEKSAIKDRQAKKKLKEKREKGKKLNPIEAARLTWDEPSWQRKNALARLPESLRNELGDDLESYVTYLKENRRYMYGSPDGWFEPLKLDEDAKELGIANHDIKILDHSISLLETDPENKMAKRILKRYTGQGFESSDQWKQWLNRRRDYLFFSEHAGFKYVLDENRVIADGHQNWLSATEQTDQDLIESVEVDEPESGQPVAFNCVLLPLDSKDAKRFRVIVKFKILAGWHIYAHVPEGQPYIQTALKLTAPEGVDTDGEWQRPVGKPSMTNGSVVVWEDEAVCTLDLTLKDESLLKETIQVEIGYQACNQKTCQRPKSEKVELKFTP